MSKRKSGKTDSGIGSITNAQELARILGIARSTVATHVKRGMPIYDQGGPRNSPRYDTASCIRWIRDQELAKRVGDGDDDSALPIEEIRRRTELAKMKKEEIDLAVTEERYADIEAVLAELGDALSTVRANLIALPKMAAQLEHQESEVIEQRLESEVYRMLDELAEFEAEGDE